MSPPVRFGKYALQEKIAVGGMAELFKAKLEGDAGFERPVAIKRILPHLAEDEEFVRMFVDEAKIAVQLSHPNIAQILDLGCEDGSYFIAQEYVHGRDVRAIQETEEQRDGRMPLGIAVHVAMKAAEGLHHAHNARGTGGGELGLIHRDVSPQNLLVSYEGEVKVVDFGLAKAAGRAVQTQAGIVKGKLAYMSPEQARGEPMDHRSDIYALGICLFEMITGHRLFLRSSDVETVMAVQRGEVPRPTGIDPQIPVELESIALRALASDPASRYPDAMEMHDELELFSFGSGCRVTRGELMSYMRELFPEGAPPMEATGGGASEPAGPPSELPEEATVAARPGSVSSRLEQPAPPRETVTARPSARETAEMRPTERPASRKSAAQPPASVQVDPSLAPTAAELDDAHPDTIPSPPLDEDADDDVTVEAAPLPPLSELSEDDFADFADEDDDEDAATRVVDEESGWWPNDG